MKTHYGYYNSYDYYGEDIPDQHYCGTWVGENYEVSPIKEHISCKKCLKKYDFFRQVENDNFNKNCEDMGKMYDWWVEQNNLQQ